MLLNLSNHPSSDWPATQLEFALKNWNKVEDLPFPNIDPNWNTDRVLQEAEIFVAMIRKTDPTAVHLMGELCFCFHLCRLLKEAGLRVVASTTQRKASIDARGNKTSTVEFVQFRDY